ncbi:MAG: hypothetical protein D6797_02830, partial [Bdellovibrio sp.]
HIIEKIDLSTNTRTTIAGQSGVAGSADGVGTAATFDTPRSIVFKSGSPDKLYVGQYGGGCLLREIDLSSLQVSTIAGGTCGEADGAGTTAKMYFGDQSTMALSGNLLYLTNWSTESIQKVDLSQNPVVVSRVAGGTSGDVDGVGTAAKLNNPASITVLGNEVYFYDAGNYKIKKMDLSTYQVTTVAGSGTPGYKDDVGTAAQFGATNLYLASDGTQYVFISDPANHVIRKLDTTTGQVSTILGKKGHGQDIDGSLSSAYTYNPRTLLFTSYGLFFDNGDAIRKAY